MYPNIVFLTFEIILDLEKITKTVQRVQYLSAGFSLMVTSYITIIKLPKTRKITLINYY